MALASPAAPPRDVASPSAAPASPCCWSSAATGRSWCSRTPTWIAPPRRRRAAHSPMPGKSALRPAACSPMKAWLIASPAGTARHAKEYVLGDPLQSGRDDGSAEQPQGRGEGARACRGGRRRRREVDDRRQAAARSRQSDLFFEPTVLTGVTAEMRINREETFGPVVPVLAFDDDEEAMRPRAGQRIRSERRRVHREPSRALRFAEAIPAGIVNINEGEHLLGNSSAVRRRLGRQAAASAGSGGS